MASKGQAKETQTDSKTCGATDLKEASSQTTSMGNCCASACSGYSEIPGSDSEYEKGGDESNGKRSKKGGKEFKWEQDLMTNTIMKTDSVWKAAIISTRDGQLRAAGPSGFKPRQRGVQDIIEALKGDTADLADEGLKLGNGVPNMVPGKLDAGKAIYASDGSGGGCTIFKTKECILIVVYKKDPAQATRLASEVAEHMEENGR